MHASTVNERKAVVILLFVSIICFFGITVCFYYLLMYQETQFNRKNKPIPLWNASGDPSPHKENTNLLLGSIIMDDFLTPIPTVVVDINGQKVVSDNNGKFIMENLVAGEQDAQIFYKNTLIHSEKIAITAGVNTINFRENLIIPELMVRQMTTEITEDEIFRPVSPKVYYRGNPEFKRIAITIDDGWRPDWKLLDLLKKYNVRCTVFLISGRGIGKRNPDYIQKMDEMGMEVCSHTYTHADLTKLTDAKIRDEVRKGQMAISNITGKIYPYMRPSGGSYNKRVLQDIADNGQKIIMWSNSIGDTVKNNTAEKQIKNVMNHLKNGDIILSHFNAYHSYQVLETIIPQILEQGYALVTVSEVLEGLEL